MINLRVVAAVSLLMLSLHVTDLPAKISTGDSSLIELRAGHHTRFLRIVFEGPESVITKGKVRKQTKDLFVSFTKSRIKIKGEELPVPYQLQDDVVRVSLEKSGNLKVFKLKDPSRLVIDVYSQENVDDNESVKQEDAEPRLSDDKKTYVASASRKTDNRITIPQRYKELWNLLESGNVFGMLANLSEHEPEGVEELAIYHYLSGEAYFAADKFIEAIDHLRLAYIYATEKALKERALLRRAEIYESIGLVYEARSNYLVFINDFPSSKYIKRAHFGLANCLSDIGALSEAVKHYEKAEDKPNVLFKKANALQKLERTEEARKTYDRALKRDKDYPEKNPETYFLIGENMRLLGKLKEARQHLSGIYYGPFKDRASISLGLIAMDRANIREAIKHFEQAVQSKDRKTRVRALFSISFAYLSRGKREEAINALEEIRRGYVNSDLYKDALIALSRLYHKEGNIRESVVLLKELVYSKKPPAEAFRELEDIVLEVSLEKGEEDADGMTFPEVWKEVGQWLINDSREEFLVKVIKKLRYEGKSFIDLCTWIIENGSQNARIKAAIALADYYIEIGEVELSEYYMTYAVGLEKPDDDALRVKVKIFLEKDEYKSAIETAKLIKDINKGDLAEIGKLLVEMDRSDHEDFQDAIEFYEKKLDESEWTAEEYIRLADTLHSNNQKSRALKYYKIAFRKDPDNEWIAYRMGRGLSGSRSEEIFARLENGDTMLSELAKSKLMEIHLMNRLEEVY